jgi:hypothetical protein
MNRFLRSLSTGLALAGASASAETVALWLFDEPAGLYPSTPLDSSAGLDAPFVLGPGGTVVPGRFGQALSTAPYPKFEIPAHGEETAALGRVPVPPGRTQEPLTWHNANFAALMTSGERHIRKQVSFIQPTATDLNLGDFDWTVEFWLKSSGERTPGTVFELGTGPRNENSVVTRLVWEPAAASFTFENQPSNTRARIKSAAVDAAWHHVAFTYRVADQRLTHYIDGRRVSSQQVALKRLPRGEEDYLSLGRDGRWQSPLPGILDEVRFSRSVVYAGDFTPPASFAPQVPAGRLVAGDPLLFAGTSEQRDVIPLGNRRHLFLDDAFLERNDALKFIAHPPRRIERVLEGIKGQFRKHLTVIEDGDGLVRIYNGGPDDYLMVHTSRDGVNFEEPDTGIHHKGRRNIVIPEHAPLGRPMIDPNGPPEHRWKYLSGLEGRGVYLYTSPDGWKWKRHPTSVMPFRSGSQSSFFYDEQRQRYVAYHRTGFPLSEGGATRREFVLSETKDAWRPWPFTPLTQQQVREIAKTRPLREPQPWWLDNGPLTPGDFGVELPTVFAPEPRLDPPGSGVYVPKAMKYPWAPDTYVAFPCMYFDYEEPGQPASRRTLMDEERMLGSGLVEVQLAVSRDGVHWTRHPAPTFVGVGEYEGRKLHQIYMSEGMIRRGDEIWQYFYGQEDYHSPVKRKPEGNGIYRAISRLDGFVSATSPYDRTIEVRSKLFTFDGKSLVLNIDTTGLGFAQVGFVDAQGKPVAGYSVDDGVYINGNYVTHTVEWLGKGTDVSALKGKPVRLVFRLRNTSLYALQFVP